MVAGSKNPDYRINGEIFDNYAPSTSSARNAASEIGRKVEAGQTNNVVVSLAAGTGRPIYEIIINSQPQRIAVTVGSSGFIVGANPAGGAK